jgi:hypothetical protein
MLYIKTMQQVIVPANIKEKQMNTFIVRAEFSALKTRSNHTFDIVFNTQEIPSEQAALLLPLLNITGSLAFKITNADIEDIAEPKPEFAGRKTLSERLRNVLYVFHEQQGGKKEDFELWRNGEMERIILHYKNKLSSE